VLYLLFWIRQRNLECFLFRNFQFLPIFVIFYFFSIFFSCFFIVKSIWGTRCPAAEPGSGRKRRLRRWKSRPFSRWPKVAAFFFSLLFLLLKMCFFKVANAAPGSLLGYYSISALFLMLHYVYWINRCFYCFIFFCCVWLLVRFLFFFSLLCSVFFFFCFLLYVCSPF
jgi:hypothetical protein